MELLATRGLPSWNEVSGLPTEQRSSTPEEHAMTSSLCHRLIGLLTLLWLGTCVPAPAHHTAQHDIPLLRQVDFVQRLHEFIPLDLVLWDETGRPVPLQDYFGRKPIILSLVYYDCPNLCTTGAQRPAQDLAGPLLDRR